MKAFKGFNKDLKCRGFQFEEGKEYTEDSAKLCESGFHACIDPIDCFSYYAPNESVYHEVELEDVSCERENDSKVCAKKIKIGAALSIKNIVDAHIDFVKSNTTMEFTDEKMATAGNRGAATAGNRGAATAGEYGAATAGNRGAATAGNRGAATAGECGAATAGECGAATAGNRGAATAGECGAATAGNRGAATAGNRGAATAGECGAATSRGSSSVGDNGLAVARGNNVKVRGGIGSILVIAVERNDSYDIIEYKTEYVDGNRVKANIWYTLKDGQFVECN